jgi:hypothetical protein
MSIRPFGLFAVPVLLSEYMVGRKGRPASRRPRALWAAGLRNGTVNDAVAGNNGQPAGDATFAQVVVGVQFGRCKRLHHEPRRVG